jgi:GTPase KRas protein
MIAEEYSALQDQWVRWGFTLQMHWIGKSLHIDSEGQGFILVYSVTSRTSFSRLEEFHQTMIRIKRFTPVFLVVGNKSDQVKREVTPEEGRRLAQKFGCQFMETSAKTSQNVEKMFTYLVRTLRQSINKSGPTPPSSTEKSGKPKKRRKTFPCIIG